MAPAHDDVEDEEMRSPAVVTVDVRMARELMASGGHRYLDVRTEEELRELGHLHVDTLSSSSSSSSLNVPYMLITPQGSRDKNPLFLHQVASLFPTKHDQLIVGCQSGKRSELACIDLLAAGFKNVKNMGGGYLAWIHNGFPVHHHIHTVVSDEGDAPPALSNADADAA